MYVGLTNLVISWSDLGSLVACISVIAANSRITLMRKNITVGMLHIRYIIVTKMTVFLEFLAGLLELLHLLLPLRCTLFR